MSFSLLLRVESPDTVFEKQGGMLIAKPHWKNRSAKSHIFYNARILMIGFVPGGVCLNSLQQEQLSILLRKLGVGAGDGVTGNLHKAG